MRARALHACLARRIEREGAVVAHAADRPVFCDATLLFATDAQTLDLAADRLSRALPANRPPGTQRLDGVRARLMRALPLAAARERAPAFRGVLTGSCARCRWRPPARACGSKTPRVRAARAGASLVPRFERQVGVAAAHLHDLSPLAVIGRGYAVARTEAGAVVKSVAHAAGSQVTVAVADGELDCRVEKARVVHTSVEPWEERA